MKSILITGGAGFIGVHLCRLLVSEGFAVSVVDLARPAVPVPGVSYHLADIRVPDQVERHVDEADAVYHFAAIVSVPVCEEKIVEGYSTNLFGTIRLLELLSNKKQRTNRTTRFVFASSAAVYGKVGRAGSAISEATPLEHPLSFYSAQKLSSEQAIRLICKRQGIPSIVFRFFNVYGPGQNASSPYSGVISVFGKAIGATGEIEIHGDGQQTRDFVSVHDVARACANALKLGAAECDGEPLNIGSGQSVSILSLVDTLSRVSQKPLSVSHVSARIGDVPHSRADISLARKKLSWVPSEALTGGLRELLEQSRD